MIGAAASGEMLRLSAPLGSSFKGAPASSRGGVTAGAHCGGLRESGCHRRAVSIKQKTGQITPSTGNGHGRRERSIRILAASERAQALTQVSLSTTAAAASRNNKKRGGVLKPPRAVTSNVATLVKEDRVCIDAAVNEALALARAAAKAARDAAAFAEAQTMVGLDEDSEQVFPCEQDLLLLERARLTEMARSGAVQVTSPSGRILKQWKEWEYSPSTVDSESVAGANECVTRELEQGLNGLPSTEEMHLEQELDMSDESGRRTRSDITVWSSRRRERILKRERALLRADMNAASAVTPGLSKAKKPQASYDSSDPVRAYLRDISKTKLLTSAEEVGLAEGIQDLLRMEGVKADLMEQMGREPSLHEWAKAVGTEHQSLESRIKSGQACKDKMVNSNLRLVVSIAKRYQGRGMTIQDLIQEGSMGLIRGAEKFDHTRGFKFSTYAHWWIRQAITRAIADQSRTIRLPVHVYELLSRITKAKSMLSAEHGRVPRDEEVAELVGLNIEKLKLVIKSAKNPKSLEFPIGRNNDTMLGEVIPDKDVESPEEAISKRLLKQDLNAVLNTLNPRERDVLKLRYGLEDGRMRTLEEVGNVFDVTRERIRQIEAKALRKLRQPSRNIALREYLDLKA